MPVAAEDNKFTKFFASCLGLSFLQVGENNAKNEEVVNIDADVSDPFMVSEYADEIFRNMKTREVRLCSSFSHECNHYSATPMELSTLVKPNFYIS